MYFDRDTEGEREVRALADELYRRAHWQWAQNGGLKVSHGWKPERGFLKNRWDGYNEALILYVLGLGSPDAPAAAQQLPSVDEDLPLEEVLRHRIPVRRAAFHAPTLAHLD